MFKYCTHSIGVKKRCNTWNVTNSCSEPTSTAEALRETTTSEPATAHTTSIISFEGWATRSFSNAMGAGFLGREKSNLSRKWRRCHDDIVDRTKKRDG